MSTRTFWIIGMLSAILLVNVILVRPVADWRLNQMITSANVPYRTVFPSRADKVSPDVLVTDQELHRVSLVSKTKLMYKKDRWGTMGVLGALGLMGLLAGGLLGSIGLRYILRIGNSIAELTTLEKVTGFLGLLLGAFISAVCLPTVLGLLGLQDRSYVFIGWCAITYICVVGLMSIKEDLRAYYVLPGAAPQPTDECKAFQKPKILDTNVIIDGRVSDVCRTGFVEGSIIVPSFVLEELQHIADSSDSLRRARGRRGLDILNAMRKELNLSIRQAMPVDPANTEEVDARLVKLAKEIDGCIVTNDFNLNKVAELQGVPVLNINELANALKPVVLPGEEMTVTVIKEGKEINQGIAYLDDGTMVVIEGARRHIGETVDVVVTSVLQTVAGKMIFANIKAVQEEEDNLIDRNVRDYSSFRPRKKTR